MQRNYSLRWHSYSDHLKNMMKEMMFNEEFSDVTLVTEDKKLMITNNILKACSPLFKGILKKEKNSSTLMYLKGINSSEMEAIIQFIYLGETTFFEESLDEFLSVAKSLEIKELYNYFQTETNEELDDEKLEEPTLVSDHFTKQAPKEENREGVNVNGLLFRTETNDELDYENLEEQTFVTDHFTNQPPQEKRRQGVKWVIDIDGFYGCEPCQKTFKSKQGFRNHTQSIHQGIKYACDECDYKATKQNHLNVHIQAKHEGAKHACNQCDYRVAHKPNLRNHILKMHDKGIRFACNQCDYQGTEKVLLRNHIKSKHEGVEIGPF